jgi:hypothetical protein
MLVDTEIDTLSEKESVKLEETVEQSSNEIPEKYQGKSLDDIIKMHQEAEKLIGKQAQEVGEVRKLADELIKQNINKNQENIQQHEPEVDFFEDPKKAIQNTVDRHPDVLAAKQATLEFKKMQIQQKLSKDHPDYIDIVQNNDFVNWVKESPVRLGLYAKADGEFDYDSANELLSTYKALRSVKSKQVENDGKEVRKQSLKAATVDTGGSGESSRRVYRRADLIRLKMTDPQRYEALSDEIMKAYQEGRVK